MVDIEKIIKYENGELSENETIKLFQKLLDDGDTWKLQGHYGRVTMDLLRAGLITSPHYKGEVYARPE